jgi:hypothetical protein
LMLATSRKASDPERETGSTLATAAVQRGIEGTTGTI